METMKKLAIALGGVVLLVLGCSATLPVTATPDKNIPLVVEYSMRYTIEVYWQGNYYPDRTTIRVELWDIPVQAPHQEVQATLGDGQIENIDGCEVWVIEKYMREVPYTRIPFYGTFRVRVNVGNTPAVPHQPLMPVSGMDEYLLPDNYVTLSAEVVNQAQQLVGETENDMPKIIAKFVDWIRKNIAYNKDVAGGKIKLTDSEVFSIRAGVCDEFSTLFMGFCRAVGIPARRVLGFGPISEENLYTQIENLGHSWTEVWVPGYGWLTVDPTWADIGDAHRIATGSVYGKNYLSWEYSGAPSGSGITEVIYTVALEEMRVVNTAGPTTLTKEETENEWRITLTNSSPIPLLDNVTVKKGVLRDSEWEWSLFSNEIIFLNPQETYKISFGKEDGIGYFVWTTKAENTIMVYQYPGATPTPTPTPTPSYSFETSVTDHEEVTCIQLTIRGGRVGLNIYLNNPSGVRVDWAYLSESDMADGVETVWLALMGPAEGIRNTADPGTYSLEVMDLDGNLVYREEFTFEGAKVSILGIEPVYQYYEDVGYYLDRLSIRYRNDGDLTAYVGEVEVSIDSVEGSDLINSEDVTDLGAGNFTVEAGDLFTGPFLGGTYTLTLTMRSGLLGQGKVLATFTTPINIPTSVATATPSPTITITTVTPSPTATTSPPSTTAPLPWELVGIGVAIVVIIALVVLVLRRR